MTFPVFQHFLSMWKARLLEHIPRPSTNIFHLDRILPWWPFLCYFLKWKNCTIKGWVIEAKIEFSERTWSVCLRRIISAFLRIFKATYLLVSLFRANLTRPNEPRNDVNKLYEELMINLFRESVLTRSLLIWASLGFGWTAFEISKISK